MDEADIAGIACPTAPQTRKRSFQEMSRGSEEASPSFIRLRPPESSSLHRNFPPPPSFRYAGDGLDLRRPIMSTRRPSENTSHEVIDLTEDGDAAPAIDSEAERRRAQRRQRRRAFRRASRSLYDNTAEQPINLTAGRGNGAPPRSNSPEVQHLYTRNVDRSGRITSNTPQPHSRLSSTGPQGSFASRLPSGGPPTRHSDEARWSNIFSWTPLSYFSETLNNFQPNLLGMAASRASLRPARHLPRFDPVRFEAPTLDFQSQAFSLGPQPPIPTYNPPPEPREGFVRSPEEDDVLICPNCGDELGSGGDEQKRQVWVVKSCGHVYCGQCAKNRTQRKAKESSIHVPFSRCVVEGCGKTKISHRTAMFQLYVN